MIHTIKKQRGLTFISLLLILGLIAFFTLLVLKIGPIYLEHSKVTNALSALENTTDVQTKDKYEILSILEKRFDLNYIDVITKDDVKVTKSGNYLKVEIKYEVVKKIFGNLSVLVEFDDSFELGDSE